MSIRKVSDGEMIGRVNR